MPEIEIPFSVQYGESSAKQNSQEILINMFAEVEISNGKSKLTRRPRPALQTRLAVAGIKRGIEKFDDLHYLVIDDSLYSYDGETLTTIGTLQSSVGPVTMIQNDNGEIGISDGQILHVWDGDNLTVTTTFGKAGHVTYIGGYGVFNETEKDRFYITNLNDFKVVSALDFAAAETYPDKTVRIFGDHGDLWMFGATSIEVWQLSGGTDFPFSRLSNAPIETGCAAAMSVISEDNTLFWLGDDGIVYNTSGYSASIVSTRPIDRMIQAIPKTEWKNAEAFVYVDGGHKFYSLTFPNHLTIQYNMATGSWNKAKTYLKNHWEIIGASGRTTDYYLGSSGIVDLVVDLCVDEGGVMEQGGISAPTYAGGKRMSIPYWRMDAEMGSAEVNETSEIRLRVSRDGRSFGNERTRTLGITGEYNNRAVWRNLGMGREFVFEIMTTDPVPLKISNIFGMIEVE